MKTSIIYLTTFLILCGHLAAQTSPEPAGRIMEAALKQASLENKNVMIIFHASWCGWCKKLDASINDPACKDFFERSFVIKHLTILESADKKNLENPGAIEIFDNNGGKGGGIPYFLIFDKTGKLLSDSKMKAAGGGPDAKSSNIGCPASDEEVAAFVEILRSVTRVSEKEADAITVRFRKNRS